MVENEAILPSPGRLGKTPYSAGVVDEDAAFAGVWIRVNSIGRRVTILSPLHCQLNTWIRLIELTLVKTHVQR